MLESGTDPESYITDYTLVVMKVVSMRELSGSGPGWRMVMPEMTFPAESSCAFKL